MISLSDATYNGTPQDIRRKIEACNVSIVFNPKDIYSVFEDREYSFHAIPVDKFSLYLVCDEILPSGSYFRWKTNYYDLLTSIDQKSMRLEVLH